MLHFVNCAHHHVNHNLEFIIVFIITISSFSLSFASLTWLNQDVYRNNTTEVAQQLLIAMQNPTLSLKKWNIISVWSLDMDVENSFAKWYCTYGAARVSPEFFPFIDEKTQQRTWGGNAVDRCKNAYDTWYKIWTTPTQWALVVYDAWGRFWSYWHVGKVVHYDRKINKLIVRDMARVGRWQMSDRREDLATANVKCYIYNSKTSLPTDNIVVENTGVVINTWTTLPRTWTIPTVIVPTPSINIPTLPVVVTPPTTTTPSPTLPETPALPSAPEAPVIIPPQTPVVSQEINNKKLSLTLDKLSDIAQHFITQNDLEITLVSKTPLILGEIATLNIEIKDKKTGELYSGLLPFAFTILSTNDTLQPDISNIQMINNGLVSISVLGQKSGTATIVIFMDDTKIGEFSLNVL